MPGITGAFNPFRKNDPNRRRGVSVTAESSSDKPGAGKTFSSHPGSAPKKPKPHTIDRGGPPGMAGGMTGHPPALRNVVTRNAAANAAAATAMGQMLGSGDSAAKVLASILAQAGKLSNNRVAPTITKALMNSLLQQQDPSTRAATETSLAYDSSIKNLQSQLDQARGSIGGIMSDLDKYYGLVDKSNQDAKAADAAMLSANTAEAGDAAKAFMAAAGGGAQEGNTSVAAQAAINDANLRGMGAAQQNFDSNLGQFFAMAGASQKAGVRAQIAHDQAALAQQLAQAQSERGLYQSKLMSDYSNQKNDLALQLQQELYNQRKDAADTQWNRLLGLANLTGMASTLPQQITQGSINTARSIEDWKRQILLNQTQRAQLQQFQRTYGGGEQFPFSQLDPGSRAKLAAQLQANLFGPKGKLVVNPNQFLSTLRNRLYNTAGYSQTPQTEAFVNSLLTPALINWWNKYHPKQKYA